MFHLRAGALRTSKSGAAEGRRPGKTGIVSACNTMPPGWSSCCPCFDGKGSEYAAIASPRRDSTASSMSIEGPSRPRAGSDSTSVPGVWLPSWVPDETQEKCYGCATAFDVVNRKHHCRRCRNIFCAVCTPPAAERPMRLLGGTNNVRLCRLCSAAVPEENDFLQFHLPVLSQGGELVVAKGLLYLKTTVHMRLSKDGAALEYREGGASEATRIPLAGITQVMEDGAVGMKVLSKGKQVLRFECLDGAHRFQWTRALRSAVKVLPGLLSLKGRIEEERAQRRLQEQMALADKEHKEQRSKQRQDKARDRAALAAKYGLPQRG